MARTIETFNVEDYIKYNWLGLGDITQLSIDNPLSLSEEWESENPHLRAFNIFRKPENFPFTCKHLLNIDIAPHQHVVLEELWRRPFPMLVCNRGYGKCVTKDTMLLSERGINYIGELMPREDMVPMHKYMTDISLRGENKFNKTEYCWFNGITATIRITTKQGYTIEGTHHHPIRAVKDGEVSWINLEDISIGQYIPIVRDVIKVPQTNFNLEINEDISWMLGLLVGDGCVSRENIILLSTADSDILARYSSITKQLFGVEPTHRQKYDYVIYGKNNASLINDAYGLGHRKSHDKQIPRTIRESGFANIAAFLQGLFDSDGCVEKKCVSYCTVSKKLAHEVHNILLYFGIVSKLKERYVKYNGGENVAYNISFSNFDSLQNFYKHIGFSCGRKQDKLEEMVFSKVKRNSNIDVIPKELITDSICKLRKTGRGYEQRLMCNSRLKTYNYSYDTLNKVLSLLDDKTETKEYKHLQAVCDKHYFYDTVEKIEFLENDTYDFYIPEDHSFLSNGFISHNTWLLAVYSILKMLLHQESKVVVCGAAFRQSKLIFEYIEKLWNNAPLLRDLTKNMEGQGIRKDVDRWTFRLGHSEGIAIPIGTGEKIRGLRANVVIGDEFRSIPVKVYEEVIEGFGAVSQTPIENMKKIGEFHAMQSLGMEVSREELNRSIIQNQSIISGTAGYIFESFGQYWLRYKGIIESRGDIGKLTKAMGGQVSEDFDWQDYSVIRIPYDILPEGHMSSKIVARSKATSTVSSHHLEYGAIFVEDSEGFFRRTLIEKCTAKDTDPVEINGNPISFAPMLKGNPNKTYVYGIDPASESDNFSIVVLEINPDHRRVVYCWTTTRSKFKAKVKQGIAYNEDEFYQYINRKIRSLMKVFPTEHIAMDMQGGGYGVAETMQSTNNLQYGDMPILPFVSYDGDPFFWEKKDKETDVLSGLHILHQCQFANAEFTSKANHGLRKDMEDKVLLFPYLDNIGLEIAIQKDREAFEKGDQTRIYDNLEDCNMEINDLKDELTTIIYTHTPGNNREKWDTPETQVVEGGKSKKGRQRKDRYSALVLANMIARTLGLAIQIPEMDSYGGFAGSIMDESKNASKSSKMYTGNPQWNIDTSLYNQGLIVRH